jgi:carbon monoxide dehydrogenase subunit G
MRLFRTLALGLFALVTGFVIIAYLLPRNVIVERQITIAAAPDAVFPLVNSLQRSTEWSPWIVLDPDMSVTYEGPPDGVGNVMIWTSEVDGVGNGRQEIVESIANERVATLLDFGEMGTADAWFNLTEVEGGTQITWGLNADMGLNPIGRWMGLMIDRLVGPDYEAGLANLQDLIETEG